MKKDSKIDEYWKVFEYEVSMYLFTRQLLISKPKLIKKNLSVKNAIVESFLLHTRILVEFFCLGRRQSDDLILEDLGIDFPPSLDITAGTDKLKDAYGIATDTDSPRWTINKMLAHPTKMRRDTYDYHAAVNKLEPHLINILNMISENCGRKKFIDFMDDMGKY